MKNLSTVEVQQAIKQGIDTTKYTADEIRAMLANENTPKLTGSKNEKNHRSNFEDDKSKMQISELSALLGLGKEDCEYILTTLGYENGCVPYADVEIIETMIDDVLADRRLCESANEVYTNQVALAEFSQATAANEGRKLAQLHHHNVLSAYLQETASRQNATAELLQWLSCGLETSAKQHQHPSPQTTSIAVKLMGKAAQATSKENLRRKTKLSIKMLGDNNK